MTAVVERVVETVWRAGRPVDLHGTMRPFLRGRSDRGHRLLDGVFWRCALTPAGPVTLALRQAARDEVHAAAWGPGAEWTIASVPDLLGARDSKDDFVPRHRVLSDMHRRHPGVWIPRSGLVMDALVPACLEQRVASGTAHQAWTFLLQRYGSAPPGPAPAGMRVPPSPAVLLTVPTWDWHRAGVDISRQRAVRAACSVAHRLEECVDLAPADALARLRVVPGVGIWTAAETAQRALGDADAVSVGDLHIPHLVGFALIGRRVDDDGMLRLLAEWPGHRHRVVRLVEMAGLGAPRYGPRFAPQDYRDF